MLNGGSHISDAQWYPQGSALAWLLQETSASIAMRKTAGMWSALKPGPLKMVFGTGDVEDLGRQIKRPKR